MVDGELAEVAKKFGTPRRTVLLEGAGAAVTAAVPLEVADDPCVVLMSATGLVARAAAGMTERALVPPPGDATRAAHDVVVSAARATVRGTIGLMTSAGRLVKLNVLELPALCCRHRRPARARRRWRAARRSPSSRPSGPARRWWALRSVDAPGAGVALGTAEGVVKRVLPDYPANRDEFELITLKSGDRVVGAVQLSAESAELVFITSDAQLLRFTASSVRPQGRAAGGMAGIRLAAGASVVWFGAVDADAAAGTPSGPPGSYSPAVVVTVAGSAAALPGTRAGSVKVSPLHEFPGKGRATAGVRCHRLLKGEDMLVMAWAGPAPAVGATDSGAPVPLPDPIGKRDGSGVGLSGPLAVLGGSVRVA